MTELTEVTVQLVPGRDDGPDDLAALTSRLRAELVDAEVVAVEPMTEPTGPEHARGVGALVSWLAVHLTAGQLRGLISAVQDWASRNKRVVEVSYGSDTLKLTGVTVAQQEKIIDDWIARHTPRP